jgi:hypothetical protein
MLKFIACLPMGSLSRSRGQLRRSDWRRTYPIETGLMAYEASVPRRVRYDKMVPNPEDNG